MPKQYPYQEKKQKTQDPNDYQQINEYYLDESLLDRQVSTLSLNTITFVEYLKVIFSGYEFNIQKWMANYDKIRIEQINQVICDAPGYKSTQIIFTYYLATSNLLNAVLMALIYPLPYTLLFIWIGWLLYQLQISQHSQFSVLLLIVLTGVRSSVIALLSKYALHIPQGKFYRIIFVASILISLAFRNNYIFFSLYIISIFLAFYAKEDGRSSKIMSQNSDDKYCKPYKQYLLPNTYPHVCIMIIGFMLIAIWFYSRYSNDWQYIVLEQFILIGMLSHTKQMTVFFPLLFVQIYGDIPNLHAADIIGINYLLPGSHLKPFFVFIGQDISYFDCAITYICLYLPSIMLICIFIGFRQKFHSLLWQNVRKAMQAVSNGLILSTVFWLLYEQRCNFNVVAYSAVVILCVVKLYYLRQLFAAILGVFLVFSRAGVLYLYKGNSFHQFVCLDTPLQNFENII